MSITDFRTVTILYTEKDQAWCDYIEGKFKSDKLHLKIETLNVTSLDYNNPPEIQTALLESYSVILLTTCYFLEYMEKHHHWFARMLETRDNSITTVVAATINVAFEELKEVTDQHDYNIDQQWEIIEIHARGINIKEFISEVLGFTDKNAATYAKRLPARTCSDPLKLNPSEPREPIQVIPDRIHKAGDKVALIFSKEKVEGSITLRSGGVNIPVETLNPYCITFKAPEITGSKISIQIYVNNTKLDRFKLYCNQALLFTSVELLCQSYGVMKKEDLDIILAEKFAASMCSDNRAMAILSDITNNMATAIGRRNSQYPTLLHWAAANGLRELCCVLLTAPGATQACNILNQDGDDVSDLAEKNGCEDLSDYILEFALGLEHIKETKQVVDACDLYVQCCSISLGNHSEYEKMSVAGNRFELLSPPPVVPRSQSPIKSATLPPPQSNTSSDPFKPPLTAQEFLSTNIKPFIFEGAVGSRSQTELIEIQEEVKKGTFTMHEAEMLFNSWKKRYETGNAISFKERKQSLQALREQNMTVLKATICKKQKKKKKKEPTIIEEIISISDPVGMRKRFETMLSYPGPGRGDSGASHDSGRYSDRESKLSQTSTSSEEVELDDEKSIIRTGRSQSEKTTGRITDSRHSNRDLYLRLQHDPPDLPESSPPPLPPRLKPPVAAAEKKSTPRIFLKPQPPLPIKKPSLPFKK